MGEFYLGLFAGIAIILVSISLVQWFGERPPVDVQPEPMRRINQLVE